MFSFLKKRIKKYCVGETILLGKYPQAQNGDSAPIEWIILDVSDNIALLISKYCVIPSAYCDVGSIQNDMEFLQWENSLARKICNNDFYNLAFSAKEKHLMLKKTNSPEGLGNACDDFVFLLTEGDVKKYYPTPEDRRAIASEYAISKGTSVGWGEYAKYSSWWIMPQHEKISIRHEMNNKKYTGSIYPKAVFFNGEIGYHSRNVYHNDFAIRPCIQIDLDAYKKLG